MPAQRAHPRASASSSSSALHWPHALAPPASDAAVPDSLSFSLSGSEAPAAAPAPAPRAPPPSLAHVVHLQLGLVPAHPAARRPPPRSALALPLDPYAAPAPPVAVAPLPGPRAARARRDEALAADLRAAPLPTHDEERAEQRIARRRLQMRRRKGETAEAWLSRTARVARAISTGSAQTPESWREHSNLHAAFASLCAPPHGRLLPRTPARQEVERLFAGGGGKGERDRHAAGLVGL